MRTATVTIDPAALSHNLSEVKKRAPNARVLAMVKADAYGHGVEAALSALQAADGIGVATFCEARQARDLGWSKTITLIEGVFCFDEWQQAILNDCSCVIHHQSQLDWALTLTPEPDSPSKNIWLKFNTGMNRLGFDEAGIKAAADQLHQKGYRIILTTHFANADTRQNPLNAEQIKRFCRMLEYLKANVSTDTQGSLCNSAGIVNFEPYHFDWVRPGIMLYGSSPVVDQSASALNLKPVMEFGAKIMALRTIRQGEGIGYGSHFVAEKDTHVALVSIGYGDGYPRGISSNAQVCLHNNADNQRYLCPIVGRVAMDMMVIDVSHIRSIALDSFVILWGQQPHIDEVAGFADTISYELLCRLSRRPTRLARLAASA